MAINTPASTGFGDYVRYDKNTDMFELPQWLLDGIDRGLYKPFLPSNLYNAINNPGPLGHRSDGVFDHEIWPSIQKDLKEAEAKRAQRELDAMVVTDAERKLRDDVNAGKLWWKDIDGVKWHADTKPPCEYDEVEICANNGVDEVELAWKGKHSDWLWLKRKVEWGF